MINNLTKRSGRSLGKLLESRDILKKRVVKITRGVKSTLWRFTYLFDAKEKPKTGRDIGITVEHASCDKVYRQNASGVIRTHRRNVAIIPWKHYCGNARNRLGRF